MNFGKKVFSKFNIFALAGLFLVGIVLIAGAIMKTGPVNYLTGQPIAFYNFKINVEEISPVSQNMAENLPNELIIKPGIYNIYSQVYNLEKEGLYRFLLPSKENQQRIVFRSDIPTLLSSVAWIYSHGTRDNGLSYDVLEKKAQKEKIVATCGGISTFIQRVLNQEKIESRIVMGLTQEQYNGYDDSHVMVEVKIDGNWRLYDLDNNAVFLKNGTYLNYLDFQKLVPVSDFEIEKLAADTEIAISNFRDKKTGYDYSLWGEEKFYSENSLRQWYKHVLQIPFIKDGSTYYYFEGDETMIESFFKNKNAKKVSQEEFLEKFYR